MKKRILMCLLVLGLVPGLMACSMEETKKILEEQGLISAQQEPDYRNLSGEMDSYECEFPPMAEYFVMHDGKYYGMVYPDWWDSEEYKTSLYSEELSSLTSKNRHRIAIKAEYDTQIPTLYVDNGDEIVFYSQNTIVDYYTFAKLEDCGYSVPIVMFEKTTDDYVYTIIDKQEELDEYANNLLPCTQKDNFLSMDLLREDESSIVLRYFSINGVDLTPDYIKDGIIKGLERNANYTFNAAVGSVNTQFVMQAEYHYFRESEIYAEAAYDTGNDNLYHIIVPDYMTTGYYMMPTGAVFRLVKGEDTYNLLDHESFNYMILNKDEAYALSDGGTRINGTTYDKEGNAYENSYGVYSSRDELNFYTTALKGEVGYKEEDSVEIGLTEAQTELPLAPIGTTKLSYYKISPQTDGKITEDAALFQLTSDVEKNPCVAVMYREDVGLHTLPVTKNGNSFIYEYLVSEGDSIKEPVYLALYCLGDEGLKFSQKNSDFTIEQITSVDEIPETLRNNKETISTKRY